MIIILSLRVGTSKNKIVDQRIKETYTYESKVVKKYMWNQYYYFAMQKRSVGWVRTTKN